MLQQQRHLTKEEEIDAGRRIQRYLSLDAMEKDGAVLSPREKREWEDGRKAAETLVLANIGLVYKAAHGYIKKYPSGMSLEDVYAEGLVGLWTAVKKYDPDRGNKFSTMAVAWIRQAIVRGANKTARLVRLPENRIADLTKILKIQSEGEEAGLSSQEIDSLVCAQVGVTKEQLHEIVSAGTMHVSLNRPTSSVDDEGGSELMNSAHIMESIPSAEDSALSEGVTTDLYRALSSLSYEDLEIFSSAHRLGLTDLSTQKAVRDKYGLSASKFHSRLQRITLRLRDDLSNSYNSSRVKTFA